MQCKKCLVGRSGDVLGAECKTPNCDGVIEKETPFSELVDILPEPMTCGRRQDTFIGGVFIHVRTSEQDRWQKFKTNGNRVCSFCGSLHPEDMFELVRQCAEAPEDAVYNLVPEIEPSDKGYKIYVHQPGVRNAHDGGIKFYTQHLPRYKDGTLLVTKQQQTEYGKAVKATKVRFAKYLETLRGPR